MNKRNSKFIPPLKSAFDFKTQEMMRQAVNALLNGQVVGGSSDQVSYSDGNTIWQHKIQEVPETFYPFKIYQPDISTLASTGITYDPTDGTPSTIAIDPTVPTNLPTTVNPITDGWRIWAIRTGVFEQRSLFYETFTYSYSAATREANAYMADYSVIQACAIGCDGIGTDKYEWISYDYDFVTQISNTLNPTGAAVKVIPIVLQGFTDSSAKTWYLYLEILPFAPTPVPVSEIGSIYALYVDDTLGYTAPEPPDTGGVEAYNSSYVLIGCISNLGNDYYETGNINNLTAYQYQAGHVLNRFGSIFQNNLGNTNSEPLLFSAGGNYRGNILADNSLTDLVFYPGDMLLQEQNIGGVYYQNLYMMTAVGFLSAYPDSDPNWVLIAGASSSSLSGNITPNT